MKFTMAGLLTLACCALATTSLMFAATTAFGQDQAKLETVGLRRIAFSDGDRALALSMFLPRVALGRSRPSTPLICVNAWGDDSRYKSWHVQLATDP